MNSNDYTSILLKSPPPKKWPKSAEEADAQVSELQRKLTLAKSDRTRHDDDWEMYRKLLRGDQVLIWDPVTGDIAAVSVREVRKYKSVRNILRPTARSLVGKMTRVIPSFRVVPASADFEEQYGAVAATAFLKYMRNNANLETKYVNAHEYLPWGGNAFLSLRWDKYGGFDLVACPKPGCNFNTQDLRLKDRECPRCVMQKQMEQQIQMMQHEASKVDVTQQLLSVAPKSQSSEEELETFQMAQHMGQNFTPEPEPTQAGPLPLDDVPGILEQIHSGFMAIDVTDFRDVYPQPGAESLQEADYYFQIHHLPTHQVKMRFPDVAEYIMPDVPNLDTNSIKRVPIQEHEWTEVIEYHEKPSMMYERGLVLWVVNNNIADVDLEPIDFDLKRFPLYHFGFDKNIGDFWYEGFIAQVWHRQRELNKVESRIGEHIDLLLRPKMQVPLNNQVNGDELSADSPQIIKVNFAAGKIEPLVWPQLPQQVFDRARVDLPEDIRTAATVTDQDVGIAGSDPNGRAMAILGAESRQQLGPISVRNYAEWKELNRGQLTIFQKRVHPDFKFSILGPEGIQSYSFQEMNLRDGWDLEIEDDGGFSTNPAVRLQQVLEIRNAAPEAFLDKAGQFDARKFIRMAKIPFPDAGSDTDATEQARAVDMIHQIEQGQYPQPNEWDDPDIFARIFVEWLRGKGRRSDPAIIQVVSQYWQYYRLFVLLTAGGQGMPPVEMLTGGAPPAPGTQMTSPGGSPANLGNPIAQAAKQDVSGADKAAEASVRMTVGHES